MYARYSSLYVISLMRNFIIRDYCQDRRKCGASVAAATVANPAVAPALIGAAGGVAQGAIGSVSSLFNQDSQLRAQRKENQLNRDWQTIEAEKARQFNMSERIASQDFQKEMVDYQNAYNDPSAQVARYRSAGMNPNLVLGSNGTQQISASPSSTNAASSPMPGSVGGLSPVQFQPLDLQLPQMFSAVGTLMKSVADAKKAGVETSWLEQSLDLNLQNLQEDLTLKQLQEKGLQLSNALAEQKLPHEVKAAISYAQKMAFDAMVSFETIGKVHNEAYLIASQERLNDALTKLHGSQYQLLKLDVQTYFSRFNQLMKLQQAQANDANAGAEEKHARVSVDKSISELMDVKRDIEKLNWSENKLTLFGRVASVYANLKNQGLINKQLQNEIDNQLGKQFLDGAEQGVDIVTKLLGIATSASK